MSAKLDVLKKELTQLIAEGRDIAISSLVQFRPEAIKGRITKDYEEKLRGIIILKAYQLWYSKALAVIRQLLPDRLDDFTSCYEYPAKRKELTVMNFRIADAMRGQSLTYLDKYSCRQESAGWSTCYPLIETQCNILQSAMAFFDSSLFEIQQVVQADLFDSELDAAKELNKKGFSRAAGAMAGVVLEKHFETVIKAHALTLGKKNPCFNDYNQRLKDEGVLDIPTWRFVQRLGDLRNLCDHNKGVDPKKEDIDELIAGVDKIMKTVA